MQKKTTILIATNNAEDAKAVKQQLSDEYQNVFTSTKPDMAVPDFENRRPDVLVLAFRLLEQAEHYYLKLYRHGTGVHPHRTVILCDKDEIRPVYELCKSGFFDDYMLFWPVTHDATRLVMAVHHALVQLKTSNTTPSALELAALTRRFGELEPLLDWVVTETSGHIDVAGRAITSVEPCMKASLDRFSSRLTQGEFADLVDVKDTKGLQDQLSRYMNEEINGQWLAVTESVLPLTECVREFREKCAPFLEFARRLNAMSKLVPATVLVVDDEEPSRTLLKMLLEQKHYQLMFAASGIEALILLRKRRPDLILMDMMMPGMDGMATTIRIKSAKQLSDIPIIMVTGNSDKTVVSSCLKAGAVDFVVKPFYRDILLDKIRKYLY
ncbi:MAG: response regulator [Methylovulum sp.]|nr:response regulator [Methylovulum sp.]